MCVTRRISGLFHVTHLLLVVIILVIISPYFPVLDQRVKVCCLLRSASGFFLIIAENRKKGENVDVKKERIREREKKGPSG